MQDTLDAIEYLNAMVDLDDYEGVHLDNWGELIGVKRPKAQELPENIFTLCDLGEANDPNNQRGFLDDTEAVLTGGYMVGPEGLESQTDPGADMSDADYRYLIRQKAAALRSRMTERNLFDYLIAFGTRCKIDNDSTVFTSDIDPQNYYDTNAWAKHYIETRGFAPSGLTVQFLDNLRTVKDI
jgi:hypothetical protein